MRYIHGSPSVSQVFGKSERVFLAVELLTSGPAGCIVRPSHLVFAGPALALFATVRRLVAGLLRYGLESVAPVGLRLLAPREGNVSLRSKKRGQIDRAVRGSFAARVYTTS